MRISTQQLFQQGIQGMRNQQGRLAETQNQLARGEKITTPADDPAGAVRAQEIQRKKDTANQYIDNNSVLESRLNLEEISLRDAGDNVQRFRELMLQANNDGNDQTSRDAIGQEMRQLLDELVGLANTQDANGEYIFAGTQTSTEPFADAGTSFVYNGDTGSREVQISPVRKIANGNPGNEIFMEVLDGNGTFKVSEASTNTGSGVIDPGTVLDASLFVQDTYTISIIAPSNYEVRDSSLALVSSGAYVEGESISFLGVQSKITGEPAIGDQFTITPSVEQSVFDTYRNVISIVEDTQNNLSSNSEFHNAMNSEAPALDQAFDKFLNVRTDVGARLNVTEKQLEIQQDLVLSYEEALSAVKDLDYAEAISQFQLQSISLQAAQQSFAQIQQLSLFNFL
ncbi:MAG: flagellar hook-associated protein FlgL [bacterium]